MNYTMLKTTILLVLFATLHKYSLCQEVSADYLNYIKKADSCYLIKDYLNSGIYFTKAFQSNSDMAKVIDRYNAACSWAMSGKLDSAFFQLNRIATKGNFKRYDALINDKDLMVLHDDKRWDTLILIVKKNAAE